MPSRRTRSKRKFRSILLTSTFSLLTFAAWPAATFALVANDPLALRQWYLERIGAPLAWDVTTGNSRSVVAVLDVGVDLDHPDLQNAIWTNPGEISGNGIDDDANGFVDDDHGWDFVANDRDPSPTYDIVGSDPRDLHHGTLVAGIIAARGNNDEGIAGIDWKAKIMPLRVLRSDGSGEVDAVLAAFRYAMREGATVVNLSFVGEDRSVEFDDAIADANRNGVIVVAAGGNEDRSGRGDLDRFPVYPICSGLDGVAVLGIAATNERDEKAAFSSYGRCIDLAAPGDRMLGALFHDPGHTIVQISETITATTFSQPYGGFFAGTSFAAPVAAGAVSLLRGILPKASPADLIGLLQRTADPIVTDHATAGRVGAGRLNLARAVQEASQQAAQVPSAGTTTMTVGTPLASVGDAVAIRVSARSASGTPLMGRIVRVRSHRATDSVQPAETTTDAGGDAVLTVRASSEGIAEFSVTVDAIDVGIVRVVFARALTAPIGPGSLLRGTASAVYIVSADGKRYVFPDAQTHRSWYADAHSVQRVPDVVLAAFPLGGLVTIRPGTFLVKVQSDPIVYAVEPTAMLRAIPDEPTARALFGDAWAQRVVDVPDTFFTAYRTGSPLTATIHPTGTLLEDTRDGTRYLIASGQRRRIDSTLAFLKNGFQWRDVLRVSAVGYSDGLPIADRESALAQPVP